MVRIAVLPGQLSHQCRLADPGLALDEEVALRLVGVGEEDLNVAGQPAALGEADVVQPVEHVVVAVLHR